MGNSIFEFENLFKVKSPFEDWVAEENNIRNKRSENRLQHQTQNNIQTFNRLVFYGGSNNDDNLFGRAADNTIKGYTDVTPQKIQIKKGGQSIIDKINSFSSNSIQSIDFFAHGNTESLLFKVDSSGNYQELYMNDALEQVEGSTSSGTDTNINGADISEIDFKLFTEASKIEIHGCNSASITPENKGVNFASEFSRLLFKDGKKNAVVIGHVDYANPNKHQTLKGDDYRHGVRRIYHNEKVLFRTKQEGKISATTINKYLNKKESEGSNYDGTKEKTW